MMKTYGPLSEKKFQNAKAEEMRLKLLYRDFAIRGNHRLGIGAMRGLIGPDCAYHLYRNVGEGNKKPVKK